MTPFELVLSRLEHVTGTGDKRSGRCPAHEDRRDSLSVRECKDGKVLLQCFAGCTTEAIVAALDLEMRNLFSSDNGNRDHPKERARIAATYDYRDERGVLLFQVVRYDPKDFRQRRPDGQGGWTWNLDGVRRVPYGSPELVAADLKRWVFVVEGEKDADALAKLGLLATCNPGGAGKWSRLSADLNPYFSGRLGAIIPDHDETGLKHAREVAASLLETAKEIRIVELPGLPPKGDVSDWLAAGGTVEELKRLVRAAKPVSAEDVRQWKANDPARVVAADTAAEEWPERRPLPGALPDVPALPEALIPEPLRPWLVDAAERSQVPLEMIAAPAMVALGSLIGRTVGVKPKRLDDWLVVPNLWGAIIGRPGVLKSPALLEATRFISALAAEAHEKYAGQAAEAEVARELVELEITGLKKRGAAKNADAAALGDDLRALLEKRKSATVTERRYVTNDATVEKLGELLNANPRGLLLMRDELPGWLRALDKPGREGDREFFLEAWNGVGRFSVDRIKRGTLHVPSLTLSVLGSIQPGKLRAYLEEAFADGAGADGLLQRFQVVVWPDVSGEWVNVDRRPDSAARERARRVFRGLDDLDARQIGATLDDGAEIPALRFSPEAQELFDAWREELERRLRSVELTETPAYEAHVAKYRSLMPSLAFVSHVVAVIGGAAPGRIPLEAAQRGAAWVEYLDAHARRVYGVEIDPGRAAARALAEKIEAGAIRDGEPLRDLYRPQWSGLRTVDNVLHGARTLAALGWVRLEERENGGRPTTLLRLHPELRGASEKRDDAPLSAASRGELEPAPPPSDGQP